MASPGPQVVWMPGGVRTEIHVDAAESGGALTVLLDHPPEGWSIPAHSHRHEAETIHIIAGHFTMLVDGVEHRLIPGRTIHIPAGAVHSSRLLGGAGKRLVTFTPGGMEGFFLEVGSSQPSSTLSFGRASAAAAVYGWDFQPFGS